MKAISNIKYRNLKDPGDLLFQPIVAGPHIIKLLDSNLYFPTLFLKDVKSLLEMIILSLTHSEFRLRERDTCTI